MSKIPVFIPYVNRPDLLERVLTWIPRRQTTTPFVINNSGGAVRVMANYIAPEVPLTFTQTQNFMLKMAKSLEVPFYMWCHCDAVLQPDSIEKLYTMAMHECSVNPKWGVIFTFYDILCAYNTAAVDAVGGYDTAFMDYTSDCDFYRRLDLAGYQRLESHLPGITHDGSQTIASDPLRRHIVGLQVPYRSTLYRSKWGNDPGRETFTRPWNGRFD